MASAHSADAWPLLRSSGKVRVEVALELSCETVVLGLGICCRSTRGRSCCARCCPSRRGRSCYAVGGFPNISITLRRMLPARRRVNTDSCNFHNGLTKSRFTSQTPSESSSEKSHSRIVPSRSRTVGPLFPNKTRCQAVRLATCSTRRSADRADPDTTSA